MRTDLDLCRNILRALDAKADRQDIELAGLAGAAGPERVREQLALLMEAGLVHGDAADAEPGRVRGLNHAGREFLRLASNDILWQRALGELAAGGAPVTLAMVRARLLEWSQFSF